MAYDRADFQPINSMPQIARQPFTLEGYAFLVASLSNGDFEVVGTTIVNTVEA